MKIALYSLNNKHTKHTELLKLSICLNAGSFASLSVVFSFKRRLEYFVSSVFSPAVTLVVLSWCCFWISRYAVPARVSLGITTILTAIVLFGSVNEAMPPVSYSKAQDYFLLVSFGFIFLSFLEFVIVLNTDPDPRWFQCLRRCFNIESDKVFITTPSYNLQYREKCHKYINRSWFNLVYVAHSTTFIKSILKSLAM